MNRSTWHLKAALVLPLLLTNSLAVVGQQGWAYDHLGHNLLVSVLFAATVESIGIYLAAEAHASLMAGDASARLRLGSYLIGLLAGALNYAHFSVGYAANAAALTFGLASSISPWLWAIRSRSLNRDRLRAMGQMDPRAVRFSILRWVLFPIRTGSAFRGAVWAGEVQPSVASATADAKRAARKAARSGRAGVIEFDGTVPAGLTWSGHDIAAHLTPGSATPATKPRAARRDSNAARVAKAAARTPDATPAQLAARLNLSDATVRRYLRSDQSSSRTSETVPSGPDGPVEPSANLPINGVDVLARVPI